MQSFFIEEDVLDHDEENDWSQLEPQYFKEFDSYYKYLDGNIYENACYYQLDPKNTRWNRFRTFI